MTTATAAAEGPIASTPASIVDAVAVTLRCAKSAVALPNCSLNAFACSGTIIATARSMAAVGSCGEKVAVASAIPVAMRTTSAESAFRSWSGDVQCRYPVNTAATTATVHRRDDREPQSGCVVVGAHGDRITAQQPDIHRHAFDDQQHQHRTRRHPPRRPRQHDPDRQQRAIAANGAATSKASTRQAFLIGSTRAARSSACRPRRRLRAAGSSAPSAACRRRFR